jgi:hypothetical protein
MPNAIAPFSVSSLQAGLTEMGNIPWGREKSRGARDEGSD